MVSKELRTQPVSSRSRTAPDPESGLLGDAIKVTVGEAPGGVELVSDKAPTVSSLAGWPGLASQLQHAHTYYVTIIARNGAGTLVAFPQPAMPITIDLTGPTLSLQPPPARHSPLDAIYWPSTDNLTLSVQSSDAESGVAEILVSIWEVAFHPEAFLRQPARLVLDWTSLGVNVTSFDGPIVAPGLESGAAYVVRVRAVNGATNATERESQVYLCDDTPPDCTHVGDGLGDRQPDIDFTNTMNLIAANWECVDLETNISLTVWEAKQTAPFEVRPHTVHALNTFSHL